MQPFAGEQRAVVVLPAEDPTLGGEAELLELEQAELEAERWSSRRSTREGRAGCSFSTASPVSRRRSPSTRTTG